MPGGSLLDDTDWRSFRLFLVDLEDGDLDHVHRQLEREIATRRDCETDFTRLFLSSLQAVDLETVQQAIGAERLAREQDRRRLEQAATRRRTRQRATF